MKNLYPFLSALILTIVSVASTTGQCDPDVQAPIAVCFANASIALDADGVAELDPGVVNGGSADNCTAPEDLLFTVAPSMFDCSHVGTTVSVSLTVFDEAFNMNVCSSDVLIRDVTPPVIFCRESVTAAIPPSGEVILTEDAFVLGAVDNCAVTYTFSPPAVGCADVGTSVPVIITATDPGGNTTTCPSTVTVVDNQPPVIACQPSATVLLPAGGTLTVDPAFIVAAVSDNCELTVVITPGTVDCSDAGQSVPVLVEVTDIAGNTSSCSGVLNVVDPEPSSCTIIGPPSIVCGASGIVFNANVVGGAGPLTYEWEIAKGLSDGWSIVSGQGTPGVIVDAGIKKLTLRLTVTDVCGKKVKCKYKTTCVDPLVAAPYSPSLEPMVSPVQQSRWTGETEALIYPNPASDHLVLQIDAGQVKSIEIMNAAGKIVAVKSEIPRGATTTLQIKDLHPGLYILVAHLDDDQKVVKRFIKE